VLTSAGFVAQPETWAGAGNEVGDASSSLAGVTNQLCRVLADNWAAWGKDDIGEAFGNGADGKPGFGPAADNLLTALAQMVNLLAQTGWGMQVSGAIYVAADVASTIGGQPIQGPWRVPQPATYKLPVVSREVIPSDSPPPMWMHILELMSSVVVGCQYPDGSFGALGDISAELKAAANSITTIAQTVQRAAGSVSSSNSGQAADAFAAHARSIVSGLEWLAWQCKALASSADNLLAQKNAARIQFWASLAFLAVMFATAQALAIFTFGASEGGFLAAVVGQGVGLRALLIFVLRMVIEGTIFSAGDDVIEQFARMHEHLQDGFSEGQFFKSAGTGALASLVTFGLVRGVYLGAGSSQALGTVVAWMENDATATLSARARGVFTRVAVNTVAGTGGNVAAQAAVDQQVDLKGAVSAALSMGIIGEGTEAGTRAAIGFRISRANADYGDSEDGTAAGAPSSTAPARPGSVRAALATTVRDSSTDSTTPPTAPDETVPAGPGPTAEVQPTPGHLDWADLPNRGIVDVPDPEPAAYNNTEIVVSTSMAAFPAETSHMVTLNDDGTATVWLHETTAAHWSHEHMATVAEPTGRVIGLRMSRDLPAGNDDLADPDGVLLAGLLRKAAAATAPLRTPSDGALGSTRADAELLAQLTGKTARAIRGGRIAPGLADEVVGGWQRALDEGRPVILSTPDGPAQITDIADGVITVRAPDGSIEHIPAAAARDRLTGDYATVHEPLHPALPRPGPSRADPADDMQQPPLVAVAPERVQVSETVRIKIRNPELTYGARKLGWRWGKALLDGQELPLMPDKGKVNPYQFHQGAEGDCGYLSIALEALRYLDKHDPQVIEEMFVHYPDEGKVIARIYDSKITWYGTREWLVSEPTGRLYELEMTDEVVIEPDSADPGRPAFVDVRHARALFVGMVEKTIAAADQTPTLFRPEDRKQGSGHGAGDTGYKLLDGSGGADWPAVLTMLTGRRARTFSDAETKDSVVFMQTVQAARQADLPVIAGTRGSYGAPAESARAEEPPWNLYWGHAYGVFSVENKLHGGVDGGYLNAHNPHGGSDHAATKGYTEPIPASANPWEAVVRRLQGGTDGGHPNSPSPQDGSEVNVKKGFPEPVPINKDLWKVFNREHWAALDFGTDPVTIENHALDAALRAGGAADLTPAPEVTETARHALRAGETAAAGPGERPVPDASRVARNLAGILQAPAPDGAALLARLHEAGGDPVTAQRVRAAYAGLTGRDLAADVRQADLGFDPGGPVARLLPDGSTTVPAASGDSVRSPGFTAALHDAIGSRDAMTASALLDQAGGKPRELWSLDDRYRESYGTGVRDHISAAFGESADGRYLRYLAGDDRLAAPAASPAEAWDMFRRLQQSTFTTSDGFEEPVPFGNHTEGAADRAHRMALALTEWGHRPGKIFAIRNNLDLHPETPYKPLNRLVPADISYNAAPVIKVTGDDGRDLDIVLDPATADRPLTVDEWLGQMGVTRDDYLRFDASGLDDSARADIEGTLTDFFFKRAQGRLYSNRALVYTTDPGTYYPFAAAGQLGLGQHLGEEALHDVEGTYGIAGTSNIVRRADIDFARLKQDYPFRSPSLRDADRQSASAQNSLEGTMYRDAAERLRLHLWDIMKSGATGQEAADQAVRALNEDPRLAILRRDLESGHSLPSSVTQYVDGSSYRQVQALARLADGINDRFRRG
jgi:hypothetical protein